MNYKISKQDSKTYLEFNAQKYEVDSRVSDFLQGKSSLSKKLEISLQNLLQLFEKDSPPISCPYKLKGSPLVSVILINYNGIEHNDSCIKSILNQSYKNIEIVMVNNSSADGSIEIVKKEFPGVKIVDPGVNTGFAKGNNIGVKYSKGEHIFILNNDTELEVDCIANLVSMSQNSKNTGAIAPKMKFYWNKNVINSFGNTIFFDNWGSDNYINFIDFGQINLPRRVMSACFGAVFIPRSVWDKVGLLDEKMFMYYEDSDWTYRARLLGYEIIASPYSVVYHKFGASTFNRPAAFKNEMVVRNRIIWAVKNLEIKNCLFAVKNYVIVDIKDSLRFLSAKEIQLFFSYFYSWLNLLVLAPRIILDRRRIQKSRIVDDREILSLSVPIIPEIYQSSLPELSIRSLRKYYLNYSVKIEPANWIELKSTNWRIWQDNPNFLVNTDKFPDELSIDLYFNKPAKKLLLIEGLFGADVDVVLDDKLVGKMSGGKSAEIHTKGLKEVFFDKGINSLKIKFGKSSGVNYLETIFLLDPKISRV